MRDVAERAGVSVQTVSNLVNARFHLMTDGTRARVEQAMTELVYHPNVAARSLRSDRAETLAFLLLDEGRRFLADPMTDLVIGGIGDVVRDRGYALLIQPARPDAPRPELLKPLLEHRADGAFLFLSGDRGLRRWYARRVAEFEFPFVLFEHIDDPRIPCVSTDDRAGARLLTEHLVSRGHSRIAFVAASVPWPMIEQRLLGYRDALAAANLTPIELFRGDWTPAAGAEHARVLMSSDEPPTVIMCSNDLLAVGAVRGLREVGLNVPADVAVTGFDDFDFAELVVPALTTVRVPGYELGRVAAELLVDQLEGRVATRRRIVLPVELRVRESG
jgi:LacI family transcriptional regulator, repressor for deo operon, udp, cdd, tsx, nupC, and nupG